ncbi:MAG TPA: tripartite tricarboxylate transporter substrate binding protein [Burkholderiales bacterium]|nr:tripartite tricarboxylate transporter substrate binding protein [Burkholderiales bacterium]
MFRFMDYPKIACIAVSLALPLTAAAQSAEGYPSHPVKILVPYAPGGATDIIARIVAAKLTESFGQSVLVENRPGASGNLALEAVAKAPADGYTLFVGNVSTNTINENTFASTLSIKPSRDLVGIAKLVEIPHIIATTANFPAGNLAELIALAKKEPGKINYASAGLGSYPHLDMEKFQKAAGIQLTHIPYKGGAGQMIPAIIAGEAPVAFLNLSSALPQIKGGRMKAIATTAPTRLAELPDVATMAEQGFPGIGTNAWQGMFAPSATPAPVVDKLYKSVAAILTNAEMKDRLSKQMLDVTLSPSPAQFQQLVEKETHAWGDFLREAKIKIE